MRGKNEFFGYSDSRNQFFGNWDFSPDCDQAEYYYTKRCWPVFLVAGLACLGLSAFAKQEMPSVLLGVLGCTFLWSIQELYEQEERVRKGWFPENPNRQK